MKRLLLIGALALGACDAPTDIANEAAPTAIEALAPADIGAF